MAEGRRTSLRGRPGRSRYWRAALAVGAFAVAVRLAVLALTLGIGAGTGPAGPAAAPTLDDVAHLHDGREYLLRGETLGAPERLAAHPAEVRRLGPGYPLLIRLASVVAPPPLAALALAILAAGVATALLIPLGLPPRAAALFAVLTPSWVAFGGTAMAEGPFLALSLLGLLAWSRGPAEPVPPGGGGGPVGKVARPETWWPKTWRGRGTAAEVAAGLAFGAAALVRPVGAVVFASLWLLRARRCRSGSPAAAAAFVAPPLGWILLASPLGSPVEQVGTYLDRDLAPPLSSLWNGFASPLADPLKWAQNLAVLLLVGTAAGLLVRRRREGARTGTEPAAVDAATWLAWLGPQVVFHLVLPSAWVFECLARFVVPALPAVAAALAPFLPRRRLPLTLLLAAVATLSVGVAVHWNLGALGHRP